MTKTIVRKLHRAGGSHTVTLPPRIIEHMNLSTSNPKSEQDISVQFALLKGGKVSISRVEPATPKRVKIPTLKDVLGSATKRDFDALCSPFSERAITPEDLGTERAAARPDLVKIDTVAGRKPRMTRTKPFKRVVTQKDNLQMAAFAAAGPAKKKGSAK